MYDAYGNLTSDANKAITLITYNHLNLPTTVTFASGDKINYIYDASGVKCSKVVTVSNTPTTTHYMDGYQYLGGKLDFFPTSEGSVEVTYDSAPNGGNNAQFNYVYHYLDHLGNIRLRYAKDPRDGELKILEEKHYYPFGLTHSGYNNTKRKFTKTAAGSITLTPVNPFLGDGFKYGFNGKEEQNELGLGWIDYGARNYDAALGRWMNVDPLAEKYESISTYAYVANNPINTIDPDGRKIIFINGKLGGGSPKGGKAYWNSSFVKGAKDYMNDNSVYYANTDYGYLSSASGRMDQGYEWAKENYATLIDGMREDETFKMVSHSMGGAYSKGVEKYLEEQGHTVEMNVMINTFEVDDIDTQDNDNTYNIDYQNTDDPVLYWFDNNVGKGKLKDANAIIREESGEDCYTCKHRSPIDGGRKFWDNLDQKIIDAEKSKPKE